MTTDRVAALVAGLARREGGAHGGRRPVAHRGGARLGIPAVRLTDGPQRKAKRRWDPAGPTSTYLPCGSALGATWSPEVVGAVGGVMPRPRPGPGRPGPAGPHRQPAPVAAGRAQLRVLLGGPAAVRPAGRRLRAPGAQAEGGDDGQAPGGQRRRDRRYTMSSDVDERALREIYLRPFELAVTEGGSLGVMTAYNRLNGRWCTEAPDLLAGILRDEWGFDGFVVTGWFGVAGTAVRGRGRRPGDAGAGQAFGPAGGGRAGRRGRREAGGRPGHPPALGVRPAGRPRRRRPRRRRVHRRSRAPGGGQAGGHRVDGPAGQRRAAAPRPGRPAHRGDRRPQHVRAQIMGGARPRCGPPTW